MWDYRRLFFRKFIFCFALFFVLLCFVVQIKTLQQLLSRKEATQREEQRLRTRLAAEKQKVEKKRQELLEKARSLESLQAELDRNERSYQRLEQQLEKDRLDERDKVDQLERRQRKMVASLAGIYPITESADPSLTLSTQTGCLAIRQCMLPGIKRFKNMNAFPPVLQDQFAAATGYITHCILLLSKYFQYPLPHPVRYLSSRSSIFTSRTQDSLDFPLYEQSMDRMAFVVGLGMLGANVEQLTRALAIDPAQSEQGTIKQLSQIFTIKGLL
eukprot:c19892_g1_i1.p1 GENE.c19892_g1_i1~~c19892_g1_i1.p1  ORF type:complete len:272 (+),score=55.70 c19892_g1_i1:440-1255(+)